MNCDKIENNTTMVGLTKFTSESRGNKRAKMALDRSPDFLRLL